jgi:hypothetical protein
MIDIRSRLLLLAALLAARLGGLRTPHFAEARSPHLFFSVNFSSASSRESRQGGLLGELGTESPLQLSL